VKLWRYPEKALQLPDSRLRADASTLAEFIGIGSHVAAGFIPALTVVIVFLGRSAI